MALSGHVVGLLKEYMQDLVEQAKQETSEHESFGFAPVPYRSDQALGDLLSILDDRIESEGIQVGLPEGVLHELWSRCNELRSQVDEQVWLDLNAGAGAPSKALIRELTYRTLIKLMEQERNR